MTDAMGMYNKIKNYGHGAKAAADSFMNGLTNKYTAGHPAPPEEMQHGLESILHKYEGKQHDSGAHATQKSGSGSEKSYNSLGLLGMLGGITALVYGAPVIAAIGFATAGAMLLSNYRKQEMKPAH